MSSTSRVGIVLPTLCLGGLLVAQAPAPAPLIQHKLETRFAEKLATVPPWQQMPALVVMNEQLDLAGWKRHLANGRATRWQTHWLLVSKAQELATRGQAPVLAKLRDFETKGHAKEVQPFWIVNAIGVHATPAALVEISQHAGVRHVEDGAIEIELIKPVASAPDVARPQAAPEPGLIDIKADFLWNLGFSGQGRIVSNLDTGVDFNHPAFSSRWVGRRRPTSQAWNSPSFNRANPTDSNGHGTHTMGTMCGSEGANQIGVAPMAEWIASDAIATTSITQVKLDVIAGFQWTADPDRNALTVDDVPDVSSNSWGLSPLVASHMSQRCDQLFWAAIDMCDAAGCAVVFAAGNEASLGGGSANLRTPADRSTTEFSCFSVGALQPGSTLIASFSSRGPSGCPNGAIKPEVCAQGQNVRSSLPGNRYGLNSGTSMACPHVAGAVALLRQVDPNLTSDKVKEYLFTTCDDLGTAGPDNTFGNGRINLQSAYNKILTDRDRVSVGVFTTTRTVAQGNNLTFAINLINHTNAAQFASVVVELEIVDLAASAPIVGPFGGIYPAGFNLDPNWPTLTFGIPASLPPAFLTYTYRLRIRAFDSSSVQMSSAHVDFKIQ